MTHLHASRQLAVLQLQDLEDKVQQLLKKSANIA